MPRRSCCATRSRSSTTTGAHPERPERIVAIEAALERARLARLRRAAVARGVAASAAGGPPASARRRASRSSARAAAGMIDMDTVVVAATRTRRRCTRRAAPSRWSTRCSSGEAATGFAACARPGHHAEPRAGDGLLPLQQRRDRGAARASRARRRAGADPRLGRPPRQRDERHLPRDASVLFCRIHQSPLYPGTGPASDLGSRRRRGLHGQPARAGRLGRRRRTARWSSTSCGRCARRTSRELVLVSAGFDAHADDPLASCRVTDAGYAAMTASLRRACAASSTCRSGSCSRAATTSARCGLGRGAGAGR